MAIRLDFTFSFQPPDSKSGTWSSRYSSSEGGERLGELRIALASAVAAFVSLLLRPTWWTKTNCRLGLA